jgi:outer membrane protein assembly factor BamA
MRLLVAIVLVWAVEGTAASQARAAHAAASYPSTCPSMRPTTRGPSANQCSESIGGASPGRHTQPALVESVIVHGNHTTPTADVLAIVGGVIGEEASDALLAAVASRLEQSGRFSGVEVRRRFLSIEDPTRVLLVIVVDERAGVSSDNLMPGAVTRVLASGMWLPVLDYQEGYGFTYGARFSFVDLLGRGTRVSLPFTWGGERQAQIEIERSLAGPVVSRVIGGGGISRRENPFFDRAALRRMVWARVDGAPRQWLSAGAQVRLSRVKFADLDERLTTIGADVTLDTRRDPALPRNALWLSLAIERVGFPAAALGLAADDASLSARRVSVDGRGYIGLLRQSVLMLRAHAVTASRALPPFEQPLLGGREWLRGYDVGSAAGDNLVASSAELLLPITPPISFGRFGVKLFADSAAVYDAGESLSTERFRWGYGAGTFVTAPLFTFGVDVGWREGGGPNAHVQLGLRLTR